MHKNMTPWRNARIAVFACAISVILFVVAMILPFYSYSYFFQGRTMTFIDVFMANNQIIIPFILIIVALLLQIAALIFMIFLSKMKVPSALGSAFSFASAFISLAILFISICRLWVIPYEFEYLAKQSLEIGYIIYIIFLLFNGILGCYMTSISGKIEEIS